jgi:hypothetical protein
LKSSISKLYYAPITRYEARVTKSCSHHVVVGQDEEQYREYQEINRTALVSNQVLKEMKLMNLLITGSGEAKK